jgi:hypothetical protein
MRLFGVARRQMNCHPDAFLMVIATPKIRTGKDQAALGNLLLRAFLRRCHRRRGLPRETRSSQLRDSINRRLCGRTVICSGLDTLDRLTL